MQMHEYSSIVKLNNRENTRNIQREYVKTEGNETNRKTIVSNYLSSMQKTENVIFNLPR